MIWTIANAAGKEIRAPGKLILRISIKDYLRPHNRMNHARAAFGISSRVRTSWKSTRPLKKSVGQGIGISFNPHNLRFSVQKGFVLLYILPKVSFLIHLLTDKLIRIECILYTCIIIFLKNVTLDLETFLFNIIFFNLVKMKSVLDKLDIL
jgi:hypothetical protein